MWSWTKSSGRRKWKFMALLFPVSVVCGCATTPHLDPNEVAALRSMSTTIFFVEPPRSLFLYSGVGPGFADFTNGPPNDIAAFTFLYGVGGAVASTLEYNKQKTQYDAFMQEFNQYDDVIRALPISNDLSESTHKAIMMVPWYRNADWKYLKPGNDSDFKHAAAQTTDAQEVIFIRPEVMFRIDAEMVRVVYDVTIYVKNPDNKYDLHRFEDHLFRVDEAIYPGNDSPTDEKEDAFDDLKLNQRLKAVFSDNGALFDRTLSSVLEISSRDIASYLTGKAVVTSSVKPPAG